MNKPRCNCVGQNGTNNGTWQNGMRQNGMMNNGAMQNGMTNGDNNRRIFNGMPVTGDLAEQIRALCFVKKELELYLDTHPNCRVAIDYFYRTNEELKRLTEQYENTVGPLTSGGVVSTDEWTWVKNPWPWQRSGDYMEPRKDD